MPAGWPLSPATDTHRSGLDSGLIRPHAIDHRCAGAAPHARSSRPAPGSSAAAARQRSYIVALMTPFAARSKR